METLINEVKKHIGVINSKFCDVITNKRKKRVWEVIAEEVSKEGKIDRSGEEVSTKFTKLKSEVKKKKGAEIKERNKTGGGPEIKFTYSCLEERILKLIGMYMYRYI